MEADIAVLRISLLNYLFCTDTDRAVSILTDVLSGLDSGEEEIDEEWAEHYAAIQPMLDLLQSPLFSALVDIKNVYQKVGEALLIMKGGKPPCIVCVCECGFHLGRISYLCFAEDKCPLKN